MATNVTTFALYTPALALIAGSGLRLRQQGIAALIILLITLMVAWVPLLLAAVVPGASTRLHGDWAHNCLMIGVATPRRPHSSVASCAASTVSNRQTAVMGERPGAHANPNTVTQPPEAG